MTGSGGEVGKMLLKIGWFFLFCSGQEGGHRIGRGRSSSARDALVGDGVDTRRV